MELQMTDDAVQDAAAQWHIRLGTPAASGADWAAFTDWLEADAAHCEAYDRVAMADAAYGEALAERPPEAQPASNDNDGIIWFKRRSFLAIAASAVLALIATPLMLGGRDLQSFETKPGETRTIALNDGSRIELNGGTRLELDRADDRYARLESGEAAFTIRHDAANPFTLDVGDSQLVDVGTLFNVRHGDDGLELAVGEGAVSFNPDDEALLVTAGNQLNFAQNAARPMLSATDPQSVGGWRTGKLIYRDAQISRIALDLSRSFGATVTVDPKISGKRFSGIIQVDRDQAATLRKVERLLGVKAKPSRGGWILTG
jgi:transmembrane sensor